MSKKAVSAIIIVALVLVGIYFVFGKKMVDTSINDELVKSMSENFTILSSSFDAPNGEVVGVITKDEMKKSLEEFLKESEFSEDVVAELTSEIRHDLNFKLIYSAGSGINGVEFKGEVEILTPEYLEVIEPLFKTKRPVKFSVVGSSDLDVGVELLPFGMSEDGFSLNAKSTILNYTLTDEGKAIKSFKLSFPDINISGLSDEAEIKLGASGFVVEAEYDKPVLSSANLIEFVISDSTQKSSLKDFNFFFSENGEGMGLEIKNIISDSKVKNDESLLKMSGTSDFESLKVLVTGSNGLTIKNFTSDAEISMDREFYLALNSGLEPTFEALSKVFGKGVKFDIKEFKFENSFGEKFSLNLNADIPTISNVEAGDESMLKTMKLKAKLALTSSVAEFLKEDPNLAFLGMFVDGMGAQFLLPDGKGIKSELEMKDGKLLINGKEFEEPFMGESSDILADDEISIGARNLQVLVTDIWAYNTARGEFDDDISMMTNIPVVKSGSKMATLKVGDKNCVDISYSGSVMFLKESSDSSDETCLEFYDNPDVSEILSSSPIDFKSGF